MRSRSFEWEGPAATAAALRDWAAEEAPEIDVAPIEPRSPRGGRRRRPPAH